MTVPRKTTASAAKLHFGELLNRCVYGGEEVIITKHDKPVAVIVRIEDWQKKQAPSVKKTTPKHLRETPYENLPPVLQKIRDLRKHTLEYQKKNGIIDNISAVQLIRMIRDEDDDE